MELQVVNYPVLLTLFLGFFAIIPVQGSNCITKAVTSTIRVTSARVTQPCRQPNCPEEFVCPQAGCRTATITHTIQVPSTWVKPVSPRSLCFTPSCLPASTQAITCENQESNCITKAVTSTIRVTSAHVTQPCRQPNCPEEFICPQAGCRTATITHTIQVPSTWVKPISPRSLCFTRSCLPASTQAITCENQASACRNTLTTTQISLTDKPRHPLPCYKPECPRKFVCPHDDCQTARVTQTLIVPSTAAAVQQPVYSSAAPCYYLSCLLPTLETASCNNNG